MQDSKQILTDSITKYIAARSGQQKGVSILQMAEEITTTIIKTTNDKSLEAYKSNYLSKHFKDRFETVNNQVR